MINDYIWHLTVVALNLMDVIILFFVSNSFGGRQLKFRDIKLPLLIPVWIGYGVIMGTIAYVIEDGILFRIITPLVLITLIKIWTKRELVDSFILWGISFIFIGAIQVTILYPLITFTEMTREIEFLLPQSITLLCAIILAIKSKLYKVFLLMQQKFYFKMFVFTLNLLFLSSMVFFDFNAEDSLEQIIIIGMLAIIAILGIGLMSVSAQKKIDEATNKYHDVVNMFNGLYLSIVGRDDYEELERQAIDIKEYLTGEIVPESEPGVELTDRIKQLLIDKLRMSGKKNELNLDVDYFEAHKEVTFTKLLLFLGILYDNALDHGTDGPISVYLNVFEDLLELSVRNASEPKTENQIARIFKQGYTTKESLGHGHGLAKLHSEIEKYQTNDFNTNISVRCDYDNVSNDYYFEIKIEIATKK